MALHLVRATTLGNELAGHEVSSREQALYVSASFVLWLLPGYLFIMPPPNPSAWSVPLSVWFYEAFALLLIYIFGVLYCLGKCRVKPERNFLIDFSCLYTPISISTLIFVWGAFHLYASLVPWWLKTLSFDGRPHLLEFLYSARFFDLMRFFAVVGGAFIIFVRIGLHMERISRLRLSANFSSSGREVSAAGADARRST